MSPRKPRAAAPKRIAFLEVNGTRYHVEAAPDTPLLWVLRDALGLKGTKYGCGVGACGICTVLADGKPIRACVVPVAQVARRAITTIESLAADPQHPLLQAWIDEQVPQCGYCQPGQLMAAAALLAQRPAPTRAEIDAAMSGVLCRCGAYQRIRRAIARAAQAPPHTPATYPLSAEPPLPAPRVLVPATAESPSQADVALGPWVRIGRTGAITVLVDRSEMGQGITTGLAMLVAEELDVALDRVRIEFAPAARAYFNPLIGEQMTGGSTGVRAAWAPLRKSAAEARARLVEAAAQAWRVAPSECATHDGTVVHAASGRAVGYGALAEQAAALATPRDVPLRTSAEFRVIGKPTPRIELPDMAYGRTQYGLDLALPGMLVATVMRPPGLSGKPARVDAKRALAVPGVRAVLKIRSGIAVVAEHAAAALAGRAALKVSWSAGRKRALSSAAIHKQLHQAVRRRGAPGRRRGDVERALARAWLTLEAVYETPYLAHATLEPMNCIADMRADGCDVWAPTQAQTATQATAAEIAGLPEKAVAVHTTFLGGGFGRRLETDFVADAVELSKRLAAPVQVMWTRSDDMQHDAYRPASIALLRGGLDERRQPIAWFCRIAGPELALEGIDMHYGIPNVREETVLADPGVPTGYWRSVGASQNAFAIESFVDELAHEAGEDPLAFRRGLLAREPRALAALDLAAEKAGWGAPLAEGKGRGIALYRSFGSWVAEVAEVAVSAKGAIRVERVVAAIDCGIAVNPDAVRQQIEGAVAFGLSAALKERITIARGGVRERTFEDYPLLTMAEMPDVEVHIVPSDAPPGGVGEPGVPPIAPAVANAVFAACGKRIRTLPLRAGRGGRAQA
jgi:isoquinoline 1-oxidoreductase beta subunit